MLRVWKLLCRKPYLTPREAAAELGWHPHNTAKTLQALGRHGCARAEGYSHNRRYRATELEPSDRRGMHPNSAQGRALGATRENIENATRVRNAMAAAGTLKFKSRKQVVLKKSVSAYSGKIALEQFWTFPTKRLQANDDVVEWGREDAPAESEAA